MRGHVVRAPAVCGRIQQVDCRWCVRLVRVHDDQAVAAVGGQDVEQVADQVAFGGVERGDAPSGFDVVEDQVSSSTVLPVPVGPQT